MVSNASGGYNSEEGEGQGRIGRLLVRSHRTEPTQPQKPRAQFVRMRDVHLLTFDSGPLYNTVQGSVADMIQPRQSAGTQQQPVSLNGTDEIEGQQQIHDVANQSPHKEHRLSNDLDVLDENILDTPTSTTFRKGIHVIPQDIYDLVARIKAVKVNNTGLPIRNQLLRELPINFNKNGIIRKNSKLRQHYGDTRLLTEREWRYLTTPGKGDDIA